MQFVGDSNKTIKINNFNQVFIFPEKTKKLYLY